MQGTLCLLLGKTDGEKCFEEIKALHPTARGPILLHRCAKTWDQCVPDRGDSTGKDPEVGRDGAGF